MGERCIIRFPSFIYMDTVAGAVGAAVLFAGRIVSTVLLYYIDERGRERLCWPTSFVIFLLSPALVFHQLNSLLDLFLPLSAWRHFQKQVYTLHNSAVIS